MGILGEGKGGGEWLACQLHWGMGGNRARLVATQSGKIVNRKDCDQSHWDARRRWDLGWAPPFGRRLTAGIVSDSHRSRPI